MDHITPQDIPRDSSTDRFFQLDGWRGISILCVLAAHLLPLGPAILKLNPTAGAMGMSLFFTLSGFLITTFLLDRPQPLPFLVRRFCRILPLAWLFMLITLWLHGRNLPEWMANFLFYLNYKPAYPQSFNSHMWSLCVEMHFYVLVALLVGVCGKRGLMLLPVACLSVTTLRVVKGVYISNATHLRIDEILVGASLALIFTVGQGRGKRWLGRISPWLAILALAVICNPYAGPLQYLRPYAGGIAIGTTLVRPDHRFSQFLKSRFLVYLATISYALYVIHGPLRAGWFAGSGTIDRYLVKRPIGIALTFALAHISTFYFEAFWIKIGKALTASRNQKVAKVSAN